MTDTEPTPPGSPVEATGTWPTMRQPMSLGINITNSERMLFPGTPQFADLLAMSQAAAGAGFDVLWFDDHFSFTRDDDLRGAWECWTQMAAIAAVVPDIHLGPMVACTAYRNPGVIAKMTEMIQDISGGRFILGLGAGWHKPEYDQFGIRFEPRVSQFEEAMHIIHGLMRYGEVDFQGAYYQANKAREPAARHERQPNPDPGRFHRGQDAEVAGALRRRLERRRLDRRHQGEDGQGRRRLRRSGTGSEVGRAAPRGSRLPARAMTRTCQAD